MPLTPLTNEEGVVYVSANGSYYAPQDIDADDLYAILQNTYLLEQFEKVMPQIFSGMYKLTMKDPEGEEDEEVSAHVLDMVESGQNSLFCRMKQSWIDIRQWGCFLCYPEWGIAQGSAEVVLNRLLRLPPESFGMRPNMTSFVYSDILQGITLNDQGQVEFWQLQEQGKFPVKLKGTVMLKDPASTKLAGTSKVIPLVPIVRMLDTCWDAQMQKVYRVGAPIIFIRVDPVGGRPDDKQYAQTILQNWGKDTMFQLRPNMTVVELNLTDSESAMTTIEKLEKRVKAHFNASSNLEKEGATIGGNNAAQKDTNDDWIAGERTMIEDLWEGMLQPYLDLNGYDGWSLELQISVKQSVPGDLELKQAQLGASTKTLSINEVRQRLGASEKSDEDMAKIAEEWKNFAPAPAVAQTPIPDFGNQTPEQVAEKAKALGAIVSIDGMDPERYLSHEDQLKFLGKK